MAKMIRLNLSIQKISRNVQKSMKFCSTIQCTCSLEFIRHFYRWEWWSIIKCVLKTDFHFFLKAYRGNETEIPKNRIDEFLTAYRTIELLLSGTLYLVGNTVTLADLSLWPQIESLSQLIPINENKFPKFVTWLERMRTLPTAEMNRQGAADHVTYYHKCIQKTLSKKQRNQKIDNKEI